MRACLWLIREYLPEQRTENPRVGGSIDGTAATLPRLRRLSIRRRRLPALETTAVISFFLSSVFFIENRKGFKP
jgi:hypothetical protein